MNSPLVSQHTYAEFLQEFADYAGSYINGSELESLLQLAKSYFNHYPLTELVGRPLSDVVGGLYQSWKFIGQFDAQQPLIKLFNPSLAQDGWLSPHTVLFILQKDMPFLVDSMRIELNRRNITIYALKSTLLKVDRDKDGKLLALESQNIAQASHEALLVLEISAHSDARLMAEICQSLHSVLIDVAQVVADFAAMKSSAIAATENLALAHKDLLVAQVDETRDFLRWLADDHFTFLGVSEYEFSEADGRRYLQEIPQKRLGVLALRNEQASALAEDEFNEGMARFHLAPQVMTFSKSAIRARVHRYAYSDYVVVKRFDTNGEILGEIRFLGLYTSQVYLMSPWEIPLIRSKVEKAFELSGLERQSHDGKNFRQILATFPRNELFLSSSSALFETLKAVTQINERAMVRLFMRRDPYGKFINFVIYVPRDYFSTRIRLAIQQLIGDAIGSHDCEFTTYFSESILARVYLVFNVDGVPPHNVDVATLEAGIINITRSWDDHLHRALLESHGEEVAAQLLREYRYGFSVVYQEQFDARTAVQDLKSIAQLTPDKTIEINVYQPLGFNLRELQFKLFHRDATLILSDVIPILENLGFKVISESSYEITGESGAVVWLHDFRLVIPGSSPVNVTNIRRNIIDAFVAVWSGIANDDSCNRLISLANMHWREVALLRAYASYMHQTLFPFSSSYIADVLVNQLAISQQLVGYFINRFNPLGPNVSAEEAASAASSLRDELVAALELVENLNEDRILRRYLLLMENTLRTNYFQADANQQAKAYLSLKFSPRNIADIPEPRPLFEIFVFSPRMEAVHLRTSRVARGGLRWSDRLQDYRTEVLGLVKAQQVKNAVIVPSGAKGGFVCKKMPLNADRDAMLKEAISCYQTMIRGMLDITDNYLGGAVQAPLNVVRYDEDDAYLVVAADKGTATFSDIANKISAEYHHWLGDAFASGGSQGYDHKAMGITARGAWISVQRHFRELQVDVQIEPVTVVGIGDMAGDVFGNGMLLSEAILVVAAFNHQHIFIDPTPDAAASYLERKRLFALPKSTWDDYDKRLMSQGGGVFSRAAKSIKLSAEMRSLLALDATHLTPNELIKALLKSKVDLIWNGGIGTYVKSALETHADVGDKANDGLRVNGNELGCKVFGEGGNLGMTQRGRIEYSLSGGRCNTDFIDNAGGVDCSDHEVNIKILLNEVVEQGDLTAKQRNQLLVEMTDEVTSLVLANNQAQALAISVAQSESLKRGAEYRRFMHWLQSQGRLNRALEYLPEDDVLLERQSKGKGLTRPELSVLISYAKAVLKEDLVKTDIADDEYMYSFIGRAFPAQINVRFAQVLARHRLRREIVATQIANDMINSMGITFAQRLMESTGASAGDVAKAYVVARDIYKLDQFYSEFHQFQGLVSADAAMNLLHSLMRKIRRATRWLLRNRRGYFQPGNEVDYFSESIHVIEQDFPQLLSEEDFSHWQSAVNELTQLGLPEHLIYIATAPSDLYSGLSVVEAARVSQRELTELAGLYFALGNRLNLPWFYNQISNLSVENNWQAMARENFLSDLETQLRNLTSILIKFSHNNDQLLLLERWSQKFQLLISRWNLMVSELQAASSSDYAIFSVALRDLLDLVQASQHAELLE